MTGRCGVEFSFLLLGMPGRGLDLS